MEHVLKIWPEHFQSVCCGDKPFELRKDDRDPPYAHGDILMLMEFDPALKIYTGHTCRVYVHSVLRNFAGLEQGFCIMAVRLDSHRFEHEKAGAEA